MFSCSNCMITIREGAKACPIESYQPPISPGTVDSTPNSARKIIKPIFHRRPIRLALLFELLHAHRGPLAKFTSLRSAGGKRFTLPPARFYHNTSREDMSWKVRFSLLPTVPKSSSSSFLIGDQSEGHSFSS